MSVIGAGAWGTALAMTAQRAGNEVIIQAHEPHVAKAINDKHENSVFLKEFKLDNKIKATTVLSVATNVDVVLLVTPAQFLRPVCEAAVNNWPSGVPAVICSKGIEETSCALMSEIVSEILPRNPIAVLSGPAFAAEVASNLPTAVTLASEDETLAKVLMETLNTPVFRIYRSRDMIGAQIGGAVKNVLAIACGIVEGRKLGDNAKSALITRGLAEITRLGIAKGAQAETFYGLSGLGDLTLTCNAMQSRNFSLGVALGQGDKLRDVLNERISITEGVYTASTMISLANQLNVDLPICSAVDRVLNHSGDIDASINSLLMRPLKAETA
jgi:glycerol-3-phosphate dehydrogenase (NAD(P)+)